MVFCGSEKFMNIPALVDECDKTVSCFSSGRPPLERVCEAGSLHMPTMSHDVKALLVGRTMNENHLALRSLRVVIQLPVLRHLPTCRRCLEPRQFAMQRNSVQNLKSCSALKTQIFDTVFHMWGKLIQLGDFFGERLQIPTWWWRKISFSISSIQFAVPFQNSVDSLLAMVV